MKKLLLSFSFVLAVGGSQAQNLFTENFDTFTALAGLGWTQTNQSTPVGASTWAQGGGTAFAGAFNGAATSFTLCNFNSTTGAGTISNWLMTPAITLQDGDVITFYTRQGGTAPSFPDNLQLRISTNGEFTAAPSGGSAGLGDYTTLAVEINPTLALAGYPLTWTQYTYTMTGLGGPTSCKLGFRYFVTDGGPSGANSNIIGVDALSVDRPLSTDAFFKSNFSVWPNPAANLINIANNSNNEITAIQMTDMNGRVVKEVKGMTNQMNITDLNAGVYFMKISTAEGTGTTKVIKR
jgi:hypothetical protein